MTASPTPAVLAAPKATHKIPRYHWTAEEKAYLQKHLGFEPTSAIARHLGRSARSVLSMSYRDEAITHPIDTPDYLTNTAIQEAFGVTCATADMMLREVLPSITLYRGERATMAVHRETLEKWITDPFNWPEIALDKIADPVLRLLVDNVRERIKPPWVRLTPTAEALGMTRQAMKYHVVTHDIEARHIRNRWWLSRIAVEKHFWPLSAEVWKRCVV